MEKRYPFPLCIQLTPPLDYSEQKFLKILDLLKKLEIYGIELNIIDFSEGKIEQLSEILKRFDLQLTMIASGAYAKMYGMNLSSTDEVIRQKGVDALAYMLNRASRMNAGVICGYMKGEAAGYRESAERQMIKSLSELDYMGVLQRAPLYLEATNHYEALLVNQVSEGVAFAKEVNGRLYVLPDTYHMNIEERSIEAVLVKYANFYKNVHISDNNRYFPGLGSIPFYPILRLLKAMDYRGTITIEGRVMKTLSEDISFSCEYLENINRQIEWCGF